GNMNVLLCERGIRTFETATRYTLDLNAVPILKAKTHLPVVVDPTHGVGLRAFIPQMSLAAVAAGADAIMMEVHDSPDVAKSDRPVVFSHVTEAAQAFLVAAIAEQIRKTFWVVCPNVRSQELLYESLLNWAPDALFLPEAEFAAVENILPDPELGAERLAL